MVINRAPAVSASGKNEEVPQDGPRKGSLCTVCEACEQSQLLLMLRGGSVRTDTDCGTGIDDAESRADDSVRPGAGPCHPPRLPILERESRPMNAKSNTAKGEHAPQVGVVDPQRRNSPLRTDPDQSFERMREQVGDEAAGCYFNDVHYEEDSFMRIGGTCLRCERGIWVEAGTTAPLSP
jgi:hypothetical protein